MTRENQDISVTWKTEKILMAPDPFSLMPFLTVILPDHSVSTGEYRLPSQMQKLVEPLKRDQ